MEKLTTKYFDGIALITAVKTGDGMDSYVRVTYIEDIHDGLGGTVQEMKVDIMDVRPLIEVLEGTLKRSDGDVV